MFRKGDCYKNFRVLDVFDVSDYHSVAFHLLHEKTGLEVVHFLNDDDENLFSFSFRTPNKKSNGAAHILEHSVLCGSERYPLKDPFVALSNQSVKTYLNALTYPDRTVYPASSIVKADYFNLMDVYGDAVFFPNLAPEIFMQEAHRLECDENGVHSIQGVVYNEMKGDYSSFESAVSNACNASVLGGSVYEKDSGGDPLEIPSITHGELVAFHEKWYRPENCLVFLYGNIPTEEQLDFLQERFLSRLEQKFPPADVSDGGRKSRVAEFLSYVAPAPMEKPVECRYEGPKGGDGDETKNTVVLNFRLGQVSDSLSAMENTVMFGVLMNHDGSSLHKALIESGLGDDIAPQSGFSSYLYESVMSFGLRGVRDGDERKVGELVLDTLKKVADDGISANDIDATMMALEFSQRSIRRSDGPYSRVLMGRIVYGWLYGFDLSRQIRQRRDLDEMRRILAQNPGFLVERMKRLLIDNEGRSLVVVVPSEHFSKERDDAEKKLVALLSERTPAEEIRDVCSRLHEFQRKEDDVSCIPHLNPRDFIIDGKPRMERFGVSVSSVDGIDSAETGRGIPLLECRENVNGLVYVNVALPVDVLDVEDYPFVPMLSLVATECGWRTLDGRELGWAESAEECALHTGGLGSMFVTTDSGDTDAAVEMGKSRGWLGRDWFMFRLSMLEEEIEPALGILADCMTGTDFHDTKRIKDLIVEGRNDMDSGIVPDGSMYVESRAKCRSSRSCAVDEIWSGLSQLMTLHGIDDDGIGALSERFRKMVARMMGGGALVNVIAEESGLRTVRKLLPSFVRKVSLRSLGTVARRSVGDFVGLTLIDGKGSGDGDEVFVVNSQVGFAAEVVGAGTLASENAGVEDVCAHWLSNNLLWERIRTIGGAYGAFCSVNSFQGLLEFSTFRDPSPFSSCDVFESCLEEASGIDFSVDDVEKAVVGDYSRWIQPFAPRDRGMTGMMHSLEGLCECDRARKFMNAIGTTAESMRESFARFRMSAGTKRRRAVMCGKGQLPDDIDSAGVKVIVLPV